MHVAHLGFSSHCNGQRQHLFQYVECEADHGQYITMTTTANSSNNNQQQKYKIKWNEMIIRTRIRSMLASLAQQLSSS